MKTSACHVAPEEVMAWVDGELSTAETKSVSEHVEQCAECTKLREQLRRTSQSLSAWKIAPMPAKLEKSIEEFTAKAACGTEIRKPRLFIRSSLWTGTQWAVVGGGAVSALLILVMIAEPNLMRSPSAASEHFSRPRQESQLLEYVPKPTVSEGRGAGGGGDRDRLQDTRKIGVMLQSAPMIARTVSLSIVVQDFVHSRSSLEAMLARYHGYSAQLTASAGESAPRSLQASLRIPESELSSAVSDLKALGRVEKESQSGEEVTQQHADLVARLKNSRETEQRLREILQQRTGKITDVLKVEEEIARVRGEIEEMEAEQKALEHRVDFATIEVQLTEEYKAELNPPAASVSTRIRNAFVAGYQNASETVLGILLFFVEYGPELLIWCGILAFPVILLWRRFRRISTLA